MHGGHGLGVTPWPIPYGVFRMMLHVLLVNPFQSFAQVLPFHYIRNNNNNSIRDKFELVGLGFASRL